MPSGKRKRGKDELVVEFDEKARKKFLIGFRSRKQARIKLMQHKRAMRVKHDIALHRKQRRDKINSLIKKHSELLKPLAFSKEGAGDDESGGDNAAAAPGAVVQHIEDDEFSKSTFGHGSVTVTTSFGLPGAQPAMPAVAAASDDATESGSDDAGADTNVTRTAAATSASAAPRPAKKQRTQSRRRGRKAKAGRGARTGTRPDRKHDKKGKAKGKKGRKGQGARRK